MRVMRDAPALPARLVSPPRLMRQPYFTIFFECLYFFFAIAHFIFFTYFAFQFAVIFIFILFRLRSAALC